MHLQKPRSLWVFLLVDKINFVPVDTNYKGFYMLMSQSKFAAKMGVKRQYINKLVHKGIIPSYDGKRVDDIEAERLMKEFQDPHRDNQRDLNKQKRKNNDLFEASNSYESIADMSEDEKQLMLQKQREKLDELQAEAEELGVGKENIDDLEKMDMKSLNKAILQQELRIKRAKADESEKKSVPVDYIQEKAFEAARLTRDGLLGIPSRLSARLAAENDPHACRVMMETEIIKQLDNLSEMFSEL
ncbi:terminase small subunit [Sulfurimonas phage SNW-1]|nr:terminase small subunit [Sulfurimonas phage SNW-1]